MTIASCHLHEDLPQPPFIHTLRIKQLKAISARQIEKSSEISNLFSIYYTLSTNDEEEKVFYKSDAIKNSLNPSWNPLDRLMFPPWVNVQSSNILFITIINNLLVLFNKYIYNGKINFIFMHIFFLNIREIIFNFDF